MLYDCGEHKLGVELAWDMRGKKGWTLFYRTITKYWEWIMGTVQGFKHLPTDQNILKAQLFFSFAI